MKLSKIIFWVLIAVIIFFTRFYDLSNSPAGLTIDEVSIGYNAYSILKTGKDEWGVFMPTSFRSVGDYKAPTLIYLTVPFVAAFGLTELAVRLPVAIFSAIGIVLFYIFVSQYIFKKKYQWVSYFSTLLFSLSPWLIPFSRSGFEAIVALSFFLLNLILFYRFSRSGKISDFFFSFVFAILSAITYHSTKIVVPLINIFLVFQHKDYFTDSLFRWQKTNKLSFFFTLTLSLLITFFYLKFFIFGDGSSRAQMTLLTKDFDFDRALVPTLRELPFYTFTSVISLILFWYKRLLEYLSPNFYITTGLGLVTPGHPGQGTIYSLEYIFLAIGLWSIVFRSEKIGIFNNFPSLQKTLLVWLFVGLLPATITNNSQHALRTLNIVPVVIILVSLGFYYTYSSIKGKFASITLLFAVGFIYMFSLIRFGDYYLLHYPLELSEARSYGWKQMAIFARDNHDKYDKVYVDPRFGTDGPFTYGVPHLYFLFYSQYDPHGYQTNLIRKTGSTDFENYIFGPFDWSEVDHGGNNLYIGSPWNFPKELLDSPSQKLFVPFLNNSSGLYAISDTKDI